MVGVAGECEGKRTVRVPVPAVVKGAGVAGTAELSTVRSRASTAPLTLTGPAFTTLEDGFRTRHTLLTSSVVGGGSAAAGRGAGDAVEVELLLPATAGALSFHGQVLQMQVAWVATPRVQGAVLSTWPQALVLALCPQSAPTSGSASAANGGPAARAPSATEAPAASAPPGLNLQGLNKALIVRVRRAS